MYNYFVTSDIHGCLTKFKTLLKSWDPNHERLLVLGDLVDRGEDTLGVILLAMELHEKYGSIILKGNHDDLFLEWLDTGEDSEFYFDNGGRATVNSFYDLDFDVTLKYTPERIREYIRTNFAKEINFLETRPLYYYDEDYIFVHAGVNLSLKNWKNTSENDLMWIRKPFIYGDNDTGKTIVFGHTIARNLHDDKSDDVWFSPCGTKIGIDGAAVFKGQLNGLKLSKNQKPALVSVR